MWPGPGHVRRRSRRPDPCRPVVVETGTRCQPHRWRQGPIVRTVVRDMGRCRSMARSIGAPGVCVCNLQECECALVHRTQIGLMEPWFDEICDPPPSMVIPVGPFASSSKPNIAGFSMRHPKAISLSGSPGSFVPMLVQSASPVVESCSVRKVSPSRATSAVQHQGSVR